jgi:hypothetical protein
MVVIGAAAMATLAVLLGSFFGKGVLFVMIILSLGIFVLTSGATLFLFQNGTLIAVVMGILGVLYILRKK